MKAFSVKFRFLVIILLVFSGKVFSQEPQKYIPCRKGKLWGLCDASKFVVVQPQYHSISWYDLSAGGFHAEQNGKFGIIDHNSAQIMPFISEQPIFVNGDKFVVSDGFGYYNYSMKTRMRMEQYIKPEDRVFRDSGWEPPYNKNKPSEIKFTWDDLDDEDLDMLKPYEDENVYQINFKTNFIEIVSKDSHIGIYIPKIKKLYKSTPEIAYVGWQSFNGDPYILTTDSSKLFGLVDEFSKEVYPIKYTSISLWDHYNLVVLSEPDPAHPQNEIFKTILPNNKILNGRFKPYEKIFKNGHLFQLYYTMINGVKNYAGEDGTLYFED